MRWNGCRPQGAIESSIGLKGEPIGVSADKERGVCQFRSFTASRMTYHSCLKRASSRSPKYLRRKDQILGGNENPHIFSATNSNASVEGRTSTRKPTSWMSGLILDQATLQSWTR